MKRHIRRVKAGELAAAMDMVWRVFAEFEAPGYSAEGVREFRRFIREDNLSEQMGSGSMILWGWYDGNAVAGLIAITVTGHINLLFVDKAYHRRGIAKALHQTAEEYFRERGVSEVTVNSSPFAVEIYRRFGFTPTDAERTVNGIRFTPMVLRLGGKPND
jgi:GNAT superfamily N-acetyltransferase